MKAADADDATRGSAGSAPRQLPHALFVCVHNAGRSQMAAAFWQRLGGDARSAGSDPADLIHPTVVAVMHEAGLDLAGILPRRLDDSDAPWADVIVTMGCGDACPYIPGKRYIDWDLEDPANKDIDAVRAIRDDINARVDALAREEFRLADHG